MSRPRAGHCWTGIRRKNGAFLALIQDWSGRWLTTGEAAAWPRCPRCRRPTNDRPFDSPLCSICYFYKSGLPVDEFWRIHDTGYPKAPYNIGRACTNQMHILRALNEPNANWRQILKSQTIPANARVNRSG
jgi:hypothetical protein